MTAPASSQSHGLTPLFIWFPMRRYLFLVFLALCCAACTRRRSASETSLPADKKPFTIYLQPYEDFPQREAEALRASITQALGRVYRGDWSHVEVLPSRPQPPHAYYKPRQRYLASALLCDLTVAGPDAFVIGLTHKDISFNIHNTKNYGIMGLTTRGHFKTIVSDYRAKGDNFLAVIVHEFGHGYYKAHTAPPPLASCAITRRIKASPSSTACAPPISTCINPLTFIHSPLLPLAVAAEREIAFPPLRHCLCPLAAARRRLVTEGTSPRAYCHVLPYRMSRAHVSIDTSCQRASRRRQTASAWDKVQ